MSLEDNDRIKKNFKRGTTDIGKLMFSCDIGYDNKKKRKVNWDVWKPKHIDPKKKGNKRI